MKKETVLIKKCDMRSNIWYKNINVYEIKCQYISEINL